MPLSYLRGARKRVKALDGVESIKRYFLTSLHCFIVRKTTMNAAAPPDCCVSMTAQLVMYYKLAGAFFPRRVPTESLSSLVG